MKNITEKFEEKFGSFDDMKARLPGNIYSRFNNYKRMMKKSDKQFKILSNNYFKDKSSLAEDIEAHIRIDRYPSESIKEDIVYKKVEEIFESGNKWRFPNVIRQYLFESIKEKLENRTMKEEEYNLFLNTPKRKLYRIAKSKKNELDLDYNLIEQLQVGNNRHYRIDKLDKLGI